MPRNIAAIVLLTLGVATAAGSYAIFVSATRLPAGDFDGQVFVLTSNPAVDISMNASFTDEDPTATGDDPPRRDTFETLRTMQLNLELEYAAAGKPSKLLVLLFGDAKIADIQQPFGGFGQRIDQFEIDHGQLRTELRTDDLPFPIERFSGRAQAFLVELPQFFVEDDPVQVFLGGELLATPARHGSGLTYVTLPAIFSEGAETQVRFDAEARLPGLWYGARKLRTSAVAGQVGLGKTIDSAEPSIDEPGWLSWSADDALSPTAMVSDRAEQQQGTKAIFVAGALGGIAGGLVLEGLVRLLPTGRGDPRGTGPRSRRPKLPAPRVGLRRPSNRRGRR